MATNPMQRKARLSFILGMLVMLVITGIIIAFLFMQLSKYQKREKENAVSVKQVLVLNQDVRSGQVITSNMFTKQSINEDMIPNNATSSVSTIQNYSLQDKEGNEVKTYYDYQKDKQSALYLENYDGDSQIKQEDNGNYYIEYIKQNDNNYFIYNVLDDEKGQINVCIRIGDNEYKLYDKSNNIVYIKHGFDNQNKFFKLSNSKEVEVQPGDVNFRSGNSTVAYEPEKKYIELNEVPLLAKVKMAKNTIITTELLAKGKNELADDVRKQEYNVFILPMDLATGDFIDIRLMLPNGQDYIVVAKKEVEVPYVNGGDSVDTIWIKVSEDEILSISSAIVDAFRMEGSKLYATKYTEAGMQEAATPTYVATDATRELMNSDPNILSTAKTALISRYNRIGYSEVRGRIDTTIQGTDDPEENLKNSMEESITKSQDERKSYLDSL